MNAAAVAGTVEIADQSRDNVTAAAVGVAVAARARVRAKAKADLVSISSCKSATIQKSVCIGTLLRKNARSFMRPLWLNHVMLGASAIAQIASIHTQMGTIHAVKLGAMTAEATAAMTNTGHASAAVNVVEMIAAASAVTADVNPVTINTGSASAAVNV